MALCSGIKRDGTRCKAQAIRTSEYCVNHHPDYEDARRRRNSKGGKRGGRGRPRMEVASVKVQLQDLVDGVLDGSVVRADASAAGQLLNILLRAIAVEAQLKEHQEFAERLEALEDLIREQRKGA